MTCEVAGHPATQVTYEETAGGVFVTNQKIELADNQVLLIAAAWLHVREMLKSKEAEQLVTPSALFLFPPGAFLLLVAVVLWKAQYGS